MKKAEVKPFLAELLELRARLSRDVVAMANAALSDGGRSSSGSVSAVPSHIADLGSDTWEQDNTLRLVNSEGEVLAQIDAALERIREGVYGSCIECNGRIPKMRLRVIPYTPYCVKCASKLEAASA